MKLYDEPLMSTFKPEYPGCCYNCNESADVCEDRDTVSCTLLCKLCWDSAGRKAAIEAAYEDTVKERKEEPRS